MLLVFPATLHACQLVSPEQTLWQAGSTKVVGKMEREEEESSGDSPRQEQGFGWFGLETDPP